MLISFINEETVSIEWQFQFISFLTDWSEISDIYEV